MTTVYPPEHHLLRELRFSFEHDAEGRRSRAWMPVVPEICTDRGSAHAGALATLVDVIGGGLAASAAAPGWIATADLTLHIVRGARPGSVVEARADVVRAGRTTVVIEVALLDEQEQHLGLATMSFAVLPRRDTNPEITSIRQSSSTMALPESRLTRPLLEELGVEIVDAAAGVIAVPVDDWCRNSMGAMQGGVVATVAEVAAENALRAATGEPLVVTDLSVTYLGFGRVGPIQSIVDVLAVADGHATSAGRARRHRFREPADDRGAHGRNPGSPVNLDGSATGREVGYYMGVTMRETAELRLEGRAPVAPHLLGPGGGVRTGALLTMLDNVGGLNGGLAALPDGWVVTTNLAARVVDLVHVGPLRLDSKVLRRGRNSVVTDVQIYDEGAPNDDAKEGTGELLVASGILTSAILVPENGPPQWERPLVLDGNHFTAPGLPLIPEWLGVRTAGDHAVEIDLVDELRNPWGILHGGVVATLVDLAAEHATGGGFTTDVVLHYLAPNRVGPVRAEARLVGPRADGTVLRVEVRDIGAERTTALAIVTCTAELRLS